MDAQGALAARATAAGAGTAPDGAPAPLLHADVAGYALARELVAAARIVDGDLIVRNLSSRNRVYALESRDGPSWLLKQGAGQTGARMVANEARAYATLYALEEPIRQYLAPWRGYDPDRGVMALELLENAVSLRALHQRPGSPPVEPAHRLGHALGLVHRSTMLAETHPAGGWLPPGLLLHRPGVELLHEGSAAAIELVKTIQRTRGFPERLDELRLQWQARAFVHLDLKWDNCLAWSEDHDRLALIDWEAAGIGDPCWDIGSALSSYLSLWISSVPIAGQTPPERFALLAERPLSDMQPAIRACWEGYLDGLGLAPAATDGWLLHAVRLAAARLVLSAFETAQVSIQLTGASMLHLQLALNMLERPHEAAVHLFGIRLRGTSAR